ncbi:serine/threonine-protein kinase [Streptomyces chryseus]|uniref:serine/threonine-protein kinase n=2 Tax=Streptomyces chryseus TaxID=68186 RepID=UPI0019B72FA5|nr:serine/threonine-protein kinase [Streptomyces chryseus]GGX19048.1 serine/threonine protein kinase [Streptomyces chryseus]
MSAEVVAGRYRLGTKIGTGGVADVYEGLDLRLRRPVAVKVFRPGADPEMEERFADEAVLLARLQHPGLVTVYDTGRHKDCGYLVMELVTGQTLRRRAATGPLEPAYVAELGAALAHALAHVHAAGIVHRDVKPSNVLLDDAGRPHLTDFGISRLINSTRNTASGALIGTAAYLAPEQVLGRGAGPAADVYALGLLLLECLKGELEYHGAPLEAALARLHRLPEIPDSVPEGLTRLLRAMTALAEEARPDAEECAHVLSALGYEPDLVAPTPAAVPAPVGRASALDTLRTAGARAPARQPHGRGRARHLMAATGTAVLTAVLGATLVASDGPGDRAERSSSTPPRVATERPPATTAPTEGTGAVGRRPAAAPSGPAPRTSDSPAPAAPVGEARWTPGEPGARPAVRTPAGDGTHAARTGTRPGSAPRDDGDKRQEKAKAKGKSEDRPGKGEPH